MRGNSGEENFGSENFGPRRGDYLSLDLEADWNYLRANLDHPAHRIGSRLGSGLAAWLSRRLHAAAAPPPQLSILARIALGPRQSLALVEAEGFHVLVGTSADGPPSFFSLAGDPVRDGKRSPDREMSLGSPAVASPPQPGRRATAGVRSLGLPSSSQGGGQAASRSFSRPRQSGRVSWV